MLYAWHDTITRWSLIVEAPTVDIARIRAVAIIRTLPLLDRDARGCLLLAIHATPPHVQDVHP
jgi:hypothetical protein